MIRTHLLVFFMVIILGGYSFFNNLAIAVPLVHIGASSYTVNGQSSLILSSEMDLKGPVGTDGNRHPAKTKWDLQWRFKHKEQNGQCGVESVQVSLGITHIKPVWRDKVGASESLVSRWLSFEEALSKIQNHHVDLAIEAATAIEDNVLDVVPQKSCADLNVVVEGIVRNIKEKYRTLKTDYEEATNFGRHNGLTLL
ncbi:MAG: DUF922 domain-containing protein [Betaproteobacteria bacterium]|nr:DUF922 domain-containing protein [Betaproteobacteria bacterium]